jgi:hypothetical protein
VVDRGIVPQLGQTKDYKTDICFFFTKHAELKRKRKDWLARTHDNGSAWNYMSICGLLFHRASTINI